MIVLFIIVVGVIAIVLSNKTITVDKTKPGEASVLDSVSPVMSKLQSNIKIPYKPAPIIKPVAVPPLIVEPFPFLMDSKFVPKAPVRSREQIIKPLPRERLWERVSEPAPRVSPWAVIEPVQRTSSWGPTIKPEPVSLGRISSNPERQML